MIKLAIEHDPSIRGTKIFMWEETPNATFKYLPVKFETEELHESSIMEPTFVFDRRKGDDFLREFANALVVAGYKPDEIKAHDKEVSALKYHLEDMRKLVFKIK